MAKKSQNAGNNNIIKDYLLIIVIALIGMAVTVTVFFRIYYISRQSIINMWSSRTNTMSQEIEQYLNVPRDAVIFASAGIEDIMSEGATNREVNDFLINASEVYTDLIEGNSTGIYGYVRGQYLDSSGWTPPAGYDASIRPWYVDAVKADGEVAFVEPYVNTQTSTQMISVSKLLNDKESVLSMDIHLYPIQKLNEDMLENKGLEMSMVIDADGFVVAHSDFEEVGKNYVNDGTEYHSKIINGALSEDSNVFSFYNGLDKKTAFSRRINNEWFTVFVFDDKILFSSILFVYLSSGLVLLIVLAALLLALRVFRKRHAETRQLQGELAAIADIYLSLSILDLKGLKLNKMWVSEWLTNILSAKQYSLTRPDEIAEGIAVESSRPMLAKFMDFPTLAERLQNTKSISHDFLSIDNQWIRMHFIAGNRDKNGNLESVIWATESIDADKRMQEEYREKAEKDALTKILNRRGGEAKLYSLFELGKKGMLMILDADHFKHVNDNYGHDVGDLVIITLANCLTDTFRDSDVVFRLGGDEFAVYASGVETAEIGRLVANRLFTNIDKIEIPGVTDWKLQISVGATFCDPGESSSFDEYFKQADKAMYTSKQRNGNCMTIYSE